MEEGEVAFRSYHTRASLQLDPAPPHTHSQNVYCDANLLKCQDQLIMHTYACGHARAHTHTTSCSQNAYREAEALKRQDQLIMEEFELQQLEGIRKREQAERDKEKKAKKKVCMSVSLLKEGWGILEVLHETTHTHTSP